MVPSLKKLAQTLDSLTEERRAILTESSAFVVIGDLSAEDASALVAIVKDMCWPITIEDAAESIIGLDDVEDEFSPFKLIISKPEAPAHISTVLTNKAFADWLARPPECAILWVARLETAFETLHVRFAPWGDHTDFAPLLSQPTARKIVRESGARFHVPSNLGPWLLREGFTISWNDSAAKIWTNLAAIALLSSLTNELEPNGGLMFRGPPVVRYTISRPATDGLSPVGFEALQNAARWVFESERDLEARHGLFTAELARSNVASADASILFEKTSAPALEGAKIAFQLGLQKLSLDSLKAMADLRKAVTDEAAKLSDTTRQLATAVASALFAGVGIIAARLTVSINGPIIVAAILILGLVLCGYVGAIITSGFQFVAIQRELRSQWRERLYRFLPEAEYDNLVAKPAAKAEKGFRTAAIAGMCLTALLMAAVVAVAFAPNSPQPSVSNAQIITGPASRTSEEAIFSAPTEAPIAKGHQD